MQKTVGLILLQTCLTPFATLSDRESCRARFELPTAAMAQETLCFSRGAWHSVLRKGPHCVSVEGKWKSEAFPENSHSHPPHPKEIRLSFYATHLKSAGTSSFTTRIWSAIESYRQKLSDALATSDPQGVLRKLILNESVSQTQSHWIRSLGFVHVFTAAGIHLYALSSGTNQLCMRLFRAFALSPVIGRIAAAILSALVWFFAWALCGFRWGMCRPIGIVLLRELGLRLGFRWRWAAPLLISLLIEWAAASVGTLEKGYENVALSMGRWHYALAVGGGLMAVQMVSRQSPWLQHFAMAVGSWVFVALLDLTQHGWLAPFTPLISLITLPILIQFIYPAVFVSLVFSMTLLQHLSSVVNLALTLLVEKTFFFDPLWIISKETAWLALIAALMLFGLELLEKKIWCQLAYGLGVLILFLRLSIEREPSLVPIRASEVELLDVRQGDATLVHLGSGKAGLIDAGSYWALSQDQWFKIFAERGVSELEWIAFTHWDEDHLMGVRRILEILPVKCVAAGKSLWETPKGQALREVLETFKTPARPLDQSCFPFHARTVITDHGVTKGNAVMSVYEVPFQGGVYLALGDANQDQEKKLLPWIDSRVDLTKPQRRILKVSHHGSRTSTDPALLKSFRPTEAWISSGVGNPHGHPTLEVLQRLHLARIPIRRTDLTGVLSTK